MKFASPLKEGILLKRHKPFLAEIAVKKDDQKIIFCPNQGILHGCDVLGSRVWFSESSISNSRYPLTWELVEVNGGHLVCVNATVAPALVLEGMQNQVIPELMHLTFVRENMTVDKRGTTVNIALSSCPDRQELTPDCYVVVKAVTMGDEIHRGFYPDMPLGSDTEQLRNLTVLLGSGIRIILFYCIQHTGINCVFPADHIDKEYGLVLRDAIRAGLEVIAYKTHMTISEIKLIGRAVVNVPERSVSKKPSCR